VTFNFSFGSFLSPPPSKGLFHDGHKSWDTLLYRLGYNDDSGGPGGEYSLTMVVFIGFPGFIMLMLLLMMMIAAVSEW